jgi:class 3 adenylate cyclase/tetratricopeptide (TPR) repeat protein
MAAALDPLACFVPALVKRRLAVDPAQFYASRGETFSAVVLFADISGYSKLASRMAEFGSQGAEELTGILNTYYGKLVGLIEAHGGDIASFAGDAILGVWPATEEDLGTAVVRATQASMDVQKLLHEYEVVPGVKLSLRMSIGAGEVLVAPVGGVDDFWQLVVVGSPLDQLRHADKLARVGEVALSAEAWALAGERIEGERLPGNYCRAHTIAGPVEPAPLAEVLLAGKSQMALRTFVPRVVLARVDAGQGEFLADLRRVSVVFVNFPGLNTESVEQLQTAMRVLQTAISRYEGTVVQFVADDKGTVGIGCFGVPPYTHEDDAVRIVRAAEMIQEQIKQHGLQANIGISTGNVFCGPVGSQQRRMYAIVGSEVNLSARLMQQAKSEILCDGETERATRGRARFQPLPRFVLKGMLQPLPVFRPLSAPTEATVDRIVGRVIERAAIVEALQAVAAGSSTTIMLEGEGGIGKSTLIGFTVAQAQLLGFRPLIGKCSSIEKQTPYFAWRSVFAELFEVDAMEHPLERQAKVVARLGSDPERSKLAPLLNPLLGIQLPDNEFVSQLAGRTRADNLHALLIALLEEACRRQPLVIVLEDVQWLDSASWRLALLVRQQLTPLALTLATRPLVGTLPDEYRELLELPPARHLKLDTLSRGDCLELARRTLGIDLLSDRLANYFFERSQGNPFFTQELANYMREAGLVVMHDGCCDLQETTETAIAANIPTAIHDLITSRIDQLSLPEQMTLKTASVIGRSFTHPVLKAIYPVARDREQLVDYLTLLDRQDLTRLEAADPVLSYLFKHVTIQQAAYDQLPVANRRLLHRGVAMWYESTHGRDPSYYPLLAYHWEKGEVVEKHVEYMAKAGAEALRAGANHEAEGFFRQALQRHRIQCGDVFPEAERIRRGHWERLRGDALYQLGNLPQSRECLERALVLLGHPAPGQSRLLVLNTLIQVAIQVVHRLRPARVVSNVAVDGIEVLHEVALANQRLAQIHYFENALGLGLNRTLRSLNSGEAATAAAPLLARSYGNLCVGLSLVPAKFLAERYARLAEASARAGNDLPSLAYALDSSCLYRLGVGQWEQTAAGAEEAVRISRELRDMERLAYGTTLLAMLHCFRANYDAAFERFQELFEIARQGGSILHEAWGRCGQGECRFRQGLLEEAIGLLEATARSLVEKNDQTEEIRANGLLAIACWQFGQEQTALNYAAATMQLLKRRDCPTCSSLEGIAGAAEVYLNHCEKHPESGTSRTLARLANRYLARYAHIFPVGQPRSLRLLGLQHSLSGAPRRAQKLWKRSIEVAERFAMPLETGLAHLEIGRHDAVDSSDRQQHLEAAARAFDASGTLRDKERALCLLG